MTAALPAQRLPSSAGAVAAGLVFDRDVAIVLLLFIVTISLAVIRLAAIFLELTGIPWDRAKFHALSAFTNTGYPTRESEEIVRHPVRRRLVATLIVLGNAGFITTIATLAGSIVQSSVTESLRNLGLIVVGVALLVWLSHRSWIAAPLRRRITAAMQSRYRDILQRPEDLLHFFDGYTLTRVALDPGSPAVGCRLRELSLKQRSVQLLAIERGATFKAVPMGDERLESGDGLILYGTAESIRQIFGAGEQRQFALVSEPFVEDG